MIFSLLFGIGFAIFLEWASARSDRPRVLLVRRFAFVALLGGLHHLLQPGEVLLPYAICGLVFLLPFSYASPLASYRVPEELAGRAGLLAALCGGFTAASRLLWRRRS